MKQLDELHFRHLEDGYAVEYCGSIIGSVVKVRTGRRPYSRFTASLSMHEQWRVSTAGASLTEDEHKAVTRAVGFKRDKTNREAAARHLIASYEGAGVAYPRRAARNAV